MRIDQAPERVRRGARALLFAVNRGAFGQGAPCTEGEAFRLGLDLMEAADIISEAREQRTYALRTQVRPPRRRAFWRRLLRI